MLTKQQPSSSEAWGIVHHVPFRTSNLENGEDVPKVSS